MGTVGVGGTVAGAGAKTAKWMLVGIRWVESGGIGSGGLEVVSGGWGVVVGLIDYIILQHVDHSQLEAQIAISYATCIIPVER